MLSIIPDARYPFIDMLNVTLNRYLLKQDAWMRRDSEANEDQLFEAKNLDTAFRYARVLLSTTRLRAETYLQQN